MKKIKETKKIIIKIIPRTKLKKNDIVIPIEINPEEEEKLKKEREEREKKKKEEKEKKRKKREEKERKEKEEQKEKELELEKIRLGEAEKVKKEREEKEKKEKEEKEKRRKKREEKERKEKEEKQKLEKEKEKEEQNNINKNTSYLTVQTDNSTNKKKITINHLQKNKDFPVKILETEEKNDNLTDRDRSSTPYKKTKNNIEANYLCERFMRN